MEEHYLQGEGQVNASEAIVERCSGEVEVVSEHGVDWEERSWDGRPKEVVCRVGDREITYDGKTKVSVETGSADNRVDMNMWTHLVFDGQTMKGKWDDRKFEVEL